MGLLATLPAYSQYPGQVAKSAKDAPELRAIAVLEWTGDPGKPKTSRLVPVAVLDGGQLQDGAIYLARPQPLALAGEVEYELQQNGKPVGLFDIKNAGQEQGSWVGYGTWKGLPVARPKPSMQELARTGFYDDAQSDVPVLHRKHHADDPPSGGKTSGSDSAGGSSSAGSGSPAPPSDPDRPTLHKKNAGDSTADTSAAAPASSTASDPDRPALHRKDSSSSAADASKTTESSSSTGDSGQPTLHRRSTGDSTDSSSTTTPAASSDPDRPALHKKDSGDSTSDTSASTTTSSSAADPDRPTLHKKSSDDTAASGSAPADDPDRPVLKKAKKKKQEDVGYSEGLAGVTDPDRPHLKRGMANGNALNVVPSLMGLPADMQQAVAVSDAKARPEHTWSYSWANPDDEAKMKASLEDVARTALGLNPPPPPPVTPPKPIATRKSAKPAPPPPEPPPPAPLLDEQYRVFELAYGSGATLVLTAHTGGPLAQQKFIALVAQPDLYGNTLVLLKSITDGAHLDETPRMRLVDAVDALADNRGELLFELRGATQRQFALYRVLRGQAEKLFVGGGGEFGSEGRE
jgi:hypothetical protein